VIAACWPSFADVPWVVSLLLISADQVPVSVPPPPATTNKSQIRAKQMLQHRKGNQVHKTGETNTENMFVFVPERSTHPLIS